MNMKMWMDGRQEDILGHGLLRMAGDLSRRGHSRSRFSFGSACKLCRRGDADSWDLVHEFYAAVRFFVFLIGRLFEAARPFACFRSGVALVFFFFE
jgi:hypothetical protein